MSSSTKIDSKGKDILILGLGEHSLSAEKCILLILLKLIQNFVWACIIMDQTVFLFV